VEYEHESSQACVEDEMRLYAKGVYIAPPEIDCRTLEEIEADIEGK